MFYFLVFLSGIFAAYFGMYISGWVSALSVGTLLLLWVSPQVAVTTYLIWSLGATAGALKKFWKSGHLPKKYLPLLCVSAIIGWELGSLILFKVPGNVMYKVTGITLIFLLVFWVWKKELGTIERHHWKKRIWLWYLINTVVATWWVLFPAWVWVVFYFIYTGIYGMTSIQAKASEALLWFIWAIPIAISVFYQGNYNMAYILCYWVGSFIWAHIGAGHLIKSWNEFLRKTVLFWVAWLATYFLIFR